MMSLSSLTKKILGGCNNQSGYWALAERIGVAVHSAPDCSTMLTAAVNELGRALDLARCFVTLTPEDGARFTGVYCARGIGTAARESFEIADAEITKELSSYQTSAEITEPAAHTSVGVSESLEACGIKFILATPIVFESKTIGAIISYRRGKKQWSSQEKQLVEAIATRLSLTLNHLQSQERARRATDRETLVNRMLTAIRSAAGIDEILRVAVESIGTTLGVTRAVAFMRSSNDMSLEAASKLTGRAEYRASVLVPSLIASSLDIEGSPLLGQLLAGEVITIPDTSEGHPIVRAIGVRLGVRALALAPIAYDGQMMAVLALEQFDRPREFSEEECKLIRLVAEQTAVALYQAELYREAEEAARREALIGKISSAIHTSLEADAVLQAIVNELGASLSACRCRLALLPDPMPEQLQITHSYTAECCKQRPHLGPVTPIVNNPLLQRTLATDGPVAIDDIMNNPMIAINRDRFVAAGVKSIMVNAIRIGGKPIGFLSLHHCERRHHWTQWEIDIVESVAEQAAVAIRQAELYREATESATRAALVNQIVAAIRRSLDLKQTLQVAVDELGRALGADRTYFRKVVGDELVVVAEYLSNPDLSLRHVPASTAGYIATHLTQTRRTLIIDDVCSFMTTSPDLAATVKSWQVEPLALSEIICPIFVNNQLWGALSISQASHARKWSASEIALTEAVTAQIEVAVSHSHLFEETRRSAQVEALISHITHGINQSNHLDEIFAIVARELGEHLATDALLIIKLDEDSERWAIECAYSNGKVARPSRFFKAIDFASFEPLMENNVIICNDAEGDPRFADYADRYLRPAGTRSFLAVRLCYKETPRLAIAAIMKSGPRAWTDEEVEVIRSATNQVFTALQRAELFHQVSIGKSEWESTFDALTDGIFIFDRHGMLRRVNQAGASFEVAHARDLIGRRCCTLLQGIESESCRVAEVISSGKPVTFELVPERLSRPVLVTMAPLIDHQSEPVINDNASDNGHDNSGSQALGAVCIVRDLSELRAAEAVAREQRSFLVKLIEHASDSIFAISPEGKVIWFNERLVTFSGYSREELSGNGLWQFLRSEEKKMAVERFTRALSGQPQTFEMHGLPKSGEARLLLITFTPIYDEGRVTSVLSIARDITEERLASERAAQADKLHALGQLASGVAHNFNNILAAILGHAQLIKRETREESLRQRIEIIEHAALDGAQTVKRIQSFGAQQDVAISEAIDINQLLQDSTELTRARWCDDAQARGLRFEVELDLKPLPVLRGSASELREVFVNIIFNALDAMPQGGRLRITTEARGAVVRASFIDNGIGMSREVREHIFEPFFTTKGATGTGLGLAVSYSIIERHGGYIEAHSNPGRGSTFLITLPVGEAKTRAIPRNRAAQVAAANILVIDDDERVREAMVGMLNSAGHRTDHAASGREALAKMELDRFELVFTDLSMPEMDGWAVASEIRRCWPEVKIILMTGYAVTAETVKNHRELVNEVVFKPIRFDEISVTLGQVLS